MLETIQLIAWRIWLNLASLWEAQSRESLPWVNVVAGDLLDGQSSIPIYAHGQCSDELTIRSHSSTMYWPYSYKLLYLRQFCGTLVNVELYRGHMETHIGLDDYLSHDIAVLRVYIPRYPRAANYCMVHSWSCSIAFRFLTYRCSRLCNSLHDWLSNSNYRYSITMLR